MEIYIHTHPPQHVFVHSSISGRLGCFRVLAIINNAATSIEVHSRLFLQNDSLDPISHELPPHSLFMYIKTPCLCSVIINVPGPTLVYSG